MSRTARAMLRRGSRRALPLLSGMAVAGFGGGWWYAGREQGSQRAAAASAPVANWVR